MNWRGIRFIIQNPEIITQEVMLKINMVEPAWAVYTCSLHEKLV